MYLLLFALAAHRTEAALFLNPFTKPVEKKPEIKVEEKHTFIDRLGDFAGKLWELGPKKLIVIFLLAVSVVLFLYYSILRCIPQRRVEPTGLCG